ncbi:MAG: class I SAM-dependent methyltransferase [archaeon]|nr:class I SAM-dependent methyltransferase [archaeon]MCP8306078.1 class I SAM-dependent methyltransferase [archaeon]
MNVAPFVGSPRDVVEKMLELVKPKPGEILYDLGSGDGRVLIMAAKKFGANCVGIELRGDLISRAVEEIKKLNLESRIQIIKGDFFDIDVSNADIVFLYLTTSANEKLRPKLEKELKKGARVASHDYEVRGWMPSKVYKDESNGHVIYLYIFDPKKILKKRETPIHESGTPYPFYYPTRPFTLF